MDAKVMKEMLDVSGNITQMFYRTQTGKTSVARTSVTFTAPFSIKCAIICSNITNISFVTLEDSKVATITDNAITFPANSANQSYTASVIVFG